MTKKLKCWRRKVTLKNSIVNDAKDPTDKRRIDGRPEFSNPKKSNKRSDNWIFRLTTKKGVNTIKEIKGRKNAIEFADNWMAKHDTC